LISDTPRQDDAQATERFVIFKEGEADSQARVTTEAEQVLQGIEERSSYTSKSVDRL